MAGLNRLTGKRISDWPHCQQSMNDIFTTPIGTRVQRRNYGSLIPMLMDRPQTSDMLIEFTLAVSSALELWEPRFIAEQVTLEKASAEGNVEMIVSGIYYPYGHLGDYSVQENQTGRFALEGAIR